MTSFSTLAALREAYTSGTMFTKINANNPEQAGMLLSYYGMTLIPPAGPNPSATPSGEVVARSTHAGGLPFSDPSSGNTYLTEFQVVGSSGYVMPQLFLICDRLWQTSGITLTITTSQTIDTPTWPARDRNGATDGEDVMVALEVITGTGNLGVITNTTIDYTNSNGDNSRTGTISSFPITCNQPSFIPFELDAGDTGVQSIQSITLGTSYVSGSVALVAYRVVAATLQYGLDLTDYPVETALSLGMPIIYNDSYLFFVKQSPGTAAQNDFKGFYALAQG